MYVHTSEFNAFTTIFLSVGPVISTLRSTRPGAGGAPFQASLSRICFDCGRKSGSTPLSSSACRITRRCNKSFRFMLNDRWSKARNAIASLLRIFRVWSFRGPRIETPWRSCSSTDILQPSRSILTSGFRTNRGRVDVGLEKCIRLAL